MLSSANNFFSATLFRRSHIQVGDFYGFWTLNIFHSFPLGSAFVCLFFLFYVFSIFTLPVLLTSFFLLMFGIFRSGYRSFSICAFALEQCIFESGDRYNSLQHFKLIVKLSRFDIKTSIVFFLPLRSDTTEVLLLYLSISLVTVHFSLPIGKCTSSFKAIVFGFC